MCFSPRPFLLFLFPRDDGRYSRKCEATSPWSVTNRGPISISHSLVLAFRLCCQRPLPLFLALFLSLFLLTTRWNRRVDERKTVLKPSSSSPYDRPITLIDRRLREDGYAIEMLFPPTERSFKCNTVNWIERPGAIAAWVTSSKKVEEINANSTLD